MQWALAEGSRFLFPCVLEGEKSELALAPAQMTINLPTHLRAVGLEDKRTRFTRSEREGRRVITWTIR